MLISQTTGNYPPEIYKDRTLSIYDILLENGETHYIDSGEVEYYNQLRKPEHIAFLNWQAPFVFNGHKVIWTPTGYVNSDFFNIFHFKYAAGRPFNKEDEEKKDPVLIIAKDYAENFFGKTDVMGEKIEIQGTIFSIIGVFEKPNLQLTFSENNLYIPRGFNKYLPQRNTSHKIYLKAKDKSSIQAMSDELNLLHKQLFQQGIFKSPPIDKDWPVMKDQVSQTFYLYTTFGLIFLLLIPAFNILSLNSEKIMNQIQQISIKRAYGATKRNILNDILTENTLLTLMGAILGILLNYPLLNILISLINKFGDISISLTMHTDIFILAGIFLLTLLFSLISCYIPARRIVNSNIAEELKGGKYE